MFDFWPYTNFHQLNLDWIIQKMQETQQQVQALNERIDDIIVVNNDYILPSTNDDTDRSADIMRYLRDYGYCFLGPGKFVIYNTINMPDNTSIKGMGSGTILQLADDSPADIAINVGSYCMVSDMEINGYSSNIPYESYNQGSRKGVALLGDYSNFGVGTYSHNFSKLSNLTIRNFNHSGIWANRNDGAASFLANNIDILRCHTGVYIELFSEFHSYNNIRCRYCNIACVMQGGNNLFSNCHFDVNLMGIKIDGENNNLVNPDHSSFSNCSICHADNDIGYAIWAEKSLIGITFTGCQIWYGKIHLKTCSGLRFVNNILSHADMDIDTANTISFMGNLFKDNPPVITITNSMRFIWENNQDDNGRLINQEVDRGSTRTLEASIIRVSDLNNTQFEVCGTCYASNRWTVTIPLPGVFSTDSFHFDISKIILLDRGQVADADLANVHVTTLSTFVRIDNIAYTGNVGDSAIINVTAHLYQNI